MRLLVALVALALWAQSAPRAQTVAILPNAETQFSDANGAPYAGGKVYLYVPGTTTPKQSWQDQAQTTLNTNPITLDSAGRALIWGNGTYREILQDSLGNTIWDQLTSAVDFSAIGTSWYGKARGTANAIVLPTPLSGAPFSGIDGQRISFEVSAANTGAVTINVSGFGAIPLVANSFNGPVPLTSGQLATNGTNGNVVNATYVQALNSFVVTSAVGGAVPVKELSGIILAANLPAGEVSPLNFGASCTGVGDDTHGVQGAISALGASGGIVQFPPGTCEVSGSITITGSGVHLRGAGTGATTVEFTGGGIQPGFVFGTNPSAASCVGASPPSGCLQAYNESISDMTIKAAGRTGGYAIFVNGVSQFTASNLYIPQAWDVLNVQYVNNAYFSNINSYSQDSGAGSAIQLWNPVTSGTVNGWYRSDVVTLNDVIVNNLNSGAICINVTGAIYTVVGFGVRALQCGLTGVAVTNYIESTAYFPEYVFFFDLEVDGGSQDGMLIDGAIDVTCSGCDINASHASGTYYPLVVDPDEGFANTRSVNIVNSDIHDGPLSAAILNGRTINVANSSFYDTNHAGSGGVAALVIAGATSDGITITGGTAGVRDGDSNYPSYSVEVGTAFTGGLQLTGVNYTGIGGVLGSVNNLSAKKIGLTGGISYNHVPITSVNCAATTVCN